MFSTTTMTTILSGAFSDTGQLLLFVLGTVIIGVIALMGVGFGVRKIRTYITGSEFVKFEDDGGGRF